MFVPLARGLGIKCNDDPIGVGDVVVVFIVEEVNCVSVETEGVSLDEGNVVGHYSFIREVKLVENNGVDVIVGQDIVDGCVVPDVLK